jgi:hypothetical protein
MSKLGKSTLKGSRRDFTKALAAVATAPIFSRAAPIVLNQPLGKAAVQAPQLDQPSPVAEALAEVVRIRYGSNLSQDQMKQVKQSIDRTLRSADRLKQFKLSNSDEPAFVFSADLHRK